ncbi:hypothetical protein SAMN04487914_10866 [Arthrobacter sp. ok909]|uniref:hypothetical protein n=1 Tax=Arthrobacter sp. ok909 TaxID=1761746 RepID=UPI00088E0DA0|nr:hypothetical protein [Arthrobacter sp. ok909]SDP32788.1 hypothetical protein SAMN04487914_10866 [Arthrobacter sp. ok909]
MPKLPVESEEIVMRRITSHLQSHWPNALYHVDFGSGANLTKAQAGKQIMLNGRRGHPDIVIYEVRGSFAGLAIEVKRESERIYKRDGTPVTEHVGEQMKYLGEMAARGWYAVFGVGAPDCIQLIDDYLGGKLEPESDQD